MILNKYTDIKITKRNINHFEKLGYVVNLKDIISIKTEDLNRGSHTIIKCKCDYCGKEKDIEFKTYYKSYKNGNIYACCQKCAQAKNKETCLERYGVDHVFKDNIVKEKSKETCLEKYGIEHFSKTENYKKKYKETCLERYGVDNVFQDNIVKEKSKETCLEKYGVENYTQTEEYKKKYKETCLEKYGVEHYTQTEEYVNNIRKKYGYFSPLEKEKFNDYSKMARNRSRKHYKRLFEEWNGRDHYDDEYILGLTDNQNDPNYPNVDHKISIKYAFENDISIEEVSSYENLCITKRSTNLKKGIKNEKDLE